MGNLGQVLNLEKRITKLSAGMVVRIKDIFAKVPFLTSLGCSSVYKF